MQADSATSKFVYWSDKGDQMKRVEGSSEHEGKVFAVTHIAQSSKYGKWGECTAYREIRQICTCRLEVIPKDGAKEAVKYKVVD